MPEAVQPTEKRSGMAPDRSAQVSEFFSPASPFAELLEFQIRFQMTPISNRHARGDSKRNRLESPKMIVYQQIWKFGHGVDMGESALGTNVRVVPIAGPWFTVSRVGHRDILTRPLPRTHAKGM
ncbi:hypothetical protein GCM10023319_80540 [Nocardia iowensis]